MNPYDDMADYIERHGWTQGVEQDADGEVCLIGAVHWVNAYFPAVLYPLAEGICARDAEFEAWLTHYEFGSDYGKILGTITHWNDHPDRTVQQVLDLLRELGKEAARGVEL